MLGHRHRPEPLSQCREVQNFNLPVSGRFETGESVVYVCVEKRSQLSRPKRKSTDMEPSGTRSAHTAYRAVGPVSSKNCTLSRTDLSTVTEVEEPNPPKTRGETVEMQ